MGRFLFSFLTLNSAEPKDEVVHSPSQQHNRRTEGSDTRRCPEEASASLQHHGETADAAALS